MAIEEEVLKNFLVQRCSFLGQPIAQERRVYRQVYFSLIQQWLGQVETDEEVRDYCLQHLARQLQLSTAEIPKEPVNFAEGLHKISSIFWHGGFSFGRRSYRDICILECVCLAGLLQNASQAQLTATLHDFCQQSKMATAEEEALQAYVASLFQPQEASVKDFFQQGQSDYAAYLKQNYQKLYRYRQRPRYHVAVCATMSSGKSTFINALLGGYYIPAGNEACTAKITSIADNDDYPELIGCYEEKKQLHTYRQPIDNQTLVQWNQDEQIDHVFLEGDLQQIGSHRAVLVVHDTPGTNSSQNPLHHKRTMAFLQHQPLQTILYVLNAEHISTTDNRTLLQEIKRTVIDKGQTKIIFLLNKIDSFDEENGDDIQQSVDNVCQSLTQLGFMKPVVIPIMAYAADLFKRALAGKAAGFTRKEILDFKDFYSYCLEDDFDATVYQQNVAVTAKVPDVSGEISIQKKTYPKQRLAEAIRRTGIYTVAALLDQALQQYQPLQAAPTTQSEAKVEASQQKGKKTPATEASANDVLREALSGSREEQAEKEEGSKRQRRQDREAKLQELYADLDEWDRQHK